MTNHQSRLQKVFRCVVLVLTTSLGAQQGEQATPLPAPTIRVTTHMVLVDVVVTDKQGKAIGGLHPEDFLVEENGKGQKISSLTTSAETSPSAGSQLPPGVYSNRAQYRSPGAPITVMLLDALNTPFTNQAYARRQMLAFVKEQFRQSDRMGIFTLTGPLSVLQDFTNDPKVLFAALQRYKPLSQELTANTPRGIDNGSGSATAASTVASVDASSLPVSDATTGAGSMTSAQADAALHAFDSVAVAYAQEQRAILTLNALNSLARILGGLPGRKNLIWVTGDLPFAFVPEERNVTNAELEETLPSLDTRRVSQHAEGNNAAAFRQMHAEEIREAAARLASAQVAVYPVDARGLSISLDVDAQETMREVAKETGGRAYVNQNEIKFGVERAFEDEAAAYTIGYYPDNKKYDGKYRSIKIKVKRDGADLRYRQGYYAIDPTQVKGYNPQQEVVSALGDVVPSTMVAFTAQVKPPSANSVPGKIGVTYLVDASTLSAEDVSGGKRLNVIFYASIYSGGKIVASSSQKVDHTFDASTYQQIVQKGLMLHMDVDPKPGEIRLAVQDARTGLVGTINAAAP